MAISWSSLKFFLIESLSQFSDDFLLLSNENPVRFRFNGRVFSAHISLIHGAGQGRVNKDEQRIQPQRNVLDTQTARLADGEQPVFVGFFEQGDAFTAWHPDHALSQEPESGGSIYARRSHRQIAQDYGAAMRIAKLKKVKMDARIVTLQALALGFYLENIDSVHAVANEGELRALIDKVASPISSANKIGAIEVEADVGGERKRITSTRTSYIRDPRFARDVLLAYRHACSVCNRQIGLVQAAHIIPHAHDDSVDAVNNGIALCVEHHKLYDDRLLLPTARKRFILNEERVEHLENIGQGSGIADIRRLAAGEYRVPDDAESHPNDEFLERGVKIRLGTDA